MPKQEQMRAWVEHWKWLGPELDRIKREELRTLTEEEAYRRADALGECLEYEHWIDPRRAAFSGLMEQQAIFSRARHSAK